MNCSSLLQTSQYSYAFQVEVFRLHYSKYIVEMSQWEKIITERYLSRSLKNKCLFLIQVMLKVRNVYVIGKNDILIRGIRTDNSYQC